MVRSALAAIMQNWSFSAIPNFPAFLFDAVAPIQIIAIHKKDIVHAASLLIYFPTHQKASAGDGIHIQTFVGRSIC